ncbi:MAG: TolC family outer membrane protein [Zoogloeaceae bacterium]|nr:TolC family outer membrane protein [Zoogloeaceae bacterium]
MKRTLIVCLASLCPLVASSADLLGTYRRAVANDAEFAAAQAERLAGEERVVQARAGLLPDVALTGSAARNVAEPAGGPSDSFSSHAWRVQLVQPLFRMQNVIAAQQGVLQTDLAGVRFGQARQDLILRVAQGYFGVLNALDALEAVTQLRAAAAEQLEIANTSFEVGTVTITDVHEAQSRYDLAQAQVIAAEASLDVARDTLARIVGGEPGELARLRPGVRFAAPEPADAASWAGVASDSSLEVQVQLLQQEIAGREVERARAGHLPTLDLVASHGNSTRQTTSLSPRTETSSIGVQLNMPLYAGGRISSVSRETAALKVRADADLESARRGAALAAREAYLGVSSGLARIRALEAAEVSSLSALEANRLGYEVGVRINIDVLNSLTQLAETRQELARARYDTLLAQLRLKAASGALDETDLESINALLAR